MGEEPGIPFCYYLGWMWMVFVGCKQNARGYMAEVWGPEAPGEKGGEVGDKEVGGGAMRGTGEGDGQHVSV